ncbi:hypothetical protein [Capnocytophaga gingivalis]|jgi:hypothetical protein|uniref:hypothetical protein n=1 Tax=Capnocytophaga gingivalis TaxID=1017 RepID=UPI002B4784EC|nr:hypothetical protein [Capnocytophaga gingivalis]MEB3015151.1 hypothetical protein [Capnocytophaga gingivalis]
MKIAYIKETGEYISAQEYRDELHFDKIYCPECYKAPLYFVPKQKTVYFRVENREDHLENCSFYQKSISNQEVVRLIKSEKEVDKERLKFLIEMNMRNALNLLRRLNAEPLINKVGIENSNNSKNTANNKNRTQEIKSITRVNISNLLKNRDEYQGEYIVIYGKAEIEETEVKEREIKETGEKFKIKSLIFRQNDKYRFKIDLAGDKQTKEKFDFGGGTCCFAVFGLLESNNNFLILKIKSLSHFKYFRKD